MIQMKVNGIKKNFYPIPNFNYYFISKDGDVYCDGFWQKDKLGRMHKTHSGIRKKTNASGYYCVGIKNKKIQVHRLLALTFIPNPKNKKCINHIDGNKLNNKIKNLEWCTHKENNIHALEKNLRKSIKHFEKKYIKNYLNSNGYNKENKHLLSLIFNVTETRIGQIYNE